MIRQLVFVQHYSRSLHSVSGTVLGAGDDAGNKIDSLRGLLSVCNDIHSFSKCSLSTYTLSQVYSSVSQNQ